MNHTENRYTWKHEDYDDQVDALRHEIERKKKVQANARGGITISVPFAQSLLKHIQTLESQIQHLKKTNAQAEERWYKTIAKTNRRTETDK